MATLLKIYFSFVYFFSCAKIAINCCIVSSKLKKDFPAYFGSVKTEDILGGAIDQIKSGLAEAPENFYEELSDAISSIVLSKKADDKKEESEHWLENNDRILEDFGGFLDNKKAFISGVGRGIVDGFKGGAKNQSAKSGDDKAGLSIVLGIFVCILFLLIKGKNAEIPAGYQVDAIVSSNVTVNVN